MAEIKLPSNLYESMMYCTNGETYVKGKDIEDYWPVYSEIPVRFDRTIYLHICRIK